MEKISRRNFLKCCAASSMGLTGLVASVGNGS